MTDDNLEPAPRKNVGKQTEQVARNEREHDRIWNAAIEAAAKIAETSKGYPTRESEEIRKLKK